MIIQMITIPVIYIYIYIYIYIGFYINRFKRAKTQSYVEKPDTNFKKPLQLMLA
jgi:hypothetical protein